MGGGIVAEGYNPASMITDATRERAVELRGVVEAQPAGRWLVLTHDNPDPDALAAAALLEHLLTEVWKRRVTVAYGGIVGRAENREMVKALGLELAHVRGLDFGRFRRFALVDTQPRTGNNQLPDAHRPRPRLRPPPAAQGDPRRALRRRPPEVRRHRHHPHRAPAGRRHPPQPRPRHRPGLRHPLRDPGLQPRVRPSGQGDLRRLPHRDQPAGVGAHPERAAAARLPAQPPRRPGEPGDRLEPDRQPPRAGRPARTSSPKWPTSSSASKG